MENREQTSSVAADLTVTGLFLLAGLFGVLVHEMWRDELEIWLIARDSGSIGQLLVNMGTEGHPVLWYLLNWALARFTDAPAAMQGLNLLIGAAGAFLVLRHAPFSQLQRILFCFGYFWLYEFTVISRSYALEFLLAFVFLALLGRRRAAVTPAMGAVLLLMANTHLYGAIIAACLSLALAWALYEHRELTARSWIGLGLAWAGIAIGAGHTYLQRLSIGEAHLGVYQPTYDARWLAEGLSTVFYGYVPLPDPGVARFWNTNVLGLLPAGIAPFVGALLSVALLVMSLRLLRRREARLAFVLGSAAMLAITLFAWYGQLRQHGHVFLLFFVCVWLDRALVACSPGASSAEESAIRRSRGPSAIASAMLTSLLAVHFLAAGLAFAMELAHPFSNAARVAGYLRQPRFDDAILVGSLDYAVQPIAAYVPKQIYYPESGEFRTFLDWGEGRRLVGPQVVLEDAVELMRQREREVLVVLCYRLAELQLGEFEELEPGARLELLAAFEGAIVPEENYYVYRLFDPQRHGFDSE